MPSTPSVACASGGPRARRPLVARPLPAYTGEVARGQISTSARCDTCTTLLLQIVCNRLVRRRWVSHAPVRTHGHPGSRDRRAHRCSEPRQVPQRDPQRWRNYRQGRCLGPSSPRLRDQQEDRGHLRCRRVDLECGSHRRARPPAEAVRGRHAHQGAAGRRSDSSGRRSRAALRREGRPQGRSPREDPGSDGCCRTVCFCSHWFCAL